jgi:hypothetical protein
MFEMLVASILARRVCCLVARAAEHTLVDDASREITGVWAWR